MLRGEDVKEALKKCSLTRREVCEKMNQKYQTLNGKINGFTKFTVKELNQLEKLIKEYPKKFEYDFDEVYRLKYGELTIFCRVLGIDTFIDTENGWMICSTYTLLPDSGCEIEFTINHDVCVGSWTVGYDLFFNKDQRLNDVEPKTLEDKILQDSIKFVVACRFSTDDLVEFIRGRYYKFDPENWNKIALNQKVDFSKFDKHFGKTCNKGDKHFGKTCNKGDKHFGK